MANVKFTIHNVKSFLESLNLLKTIVKGKNTIPVLDCIKIEVEKDKVILTGTDLDNTLQCTLDANASDTGAFCVLLKDLTESISKQADSIFFDVATKSVFPNETDTIAHTKKRYADSDFNDKEAITLDTVYKMEIEKGEYPSGFKFADIKKAMPKLINDKLICVETLKHTGVISLTDAGREFAKMNSDAPTHTVNLTVKSGSANYKLTCVHSENFPLIETKDEMQLGVIGTKVLQDLIKKTRFAVTKEQSRFTLSCFAMEFGKKGLRLITTDGHRAALADTKDFRENRPAEIKAKDFNDRTENFLLNYDGGICLSKIAVGQVDISADINHLIFTTKSGERKLTCRKSSGQFPNYRMILPKDSIFSFRFHGKEVLPVLESAIKFANPRTQAVLMQPYYNNLVIKTDYSEKKFNGKATCDFPQNTAPGFSINGNFFADACRNTDEILTLNYKDGKAQFDITGENDLCSYRFIIMPLSLGKNLPADYYANYQIISADEKDELKQVPFYKIANPPKAKTNKKDAISEIDELLTQLLNVSKIDGMPEMFKDVVAELVGDAKSKLNSL